MIRTKTHIIERAILVGINKPDQDRWLINDYLDELEMLVETAGAKVLERVIQDRNRIDPAYFIGKGKVHEIAKTAKYLDADFIVFDDDLSPAQVKNIENICSVKVLDRSGIILDIFAKHAKTREARTQVELAQLKYLYPRLTRQWQHLSRQVGGIGVRGPGETQLEVDRRLIRRRIGVLEKELEKISSQRKVQRKRRKSTYKIALVGYTNVGKSTLLNVLTQSNITVENQLFATLDSTVRTLDVDDEKSLLLIDTVGFIRKLPHHLVASFKSTLEEVVQADFLLHVIDITHPNFREQMNTVNKVLSEMKIAEKPIIKVFNKIDMLTDSKLISHLKGKEQPCVFISAERGLFLTQLFEKIETMVEKSYEYIELKISLGYPELVSNVYNIAKVLSIKYQNNSAIFRLKVDTANSRKIRKIAEKGEILTEQTVES